MSENRGWLLLTNDDGIEAEGFRLLVQALHREGHNIVVLAPSENHSAAGMRINLMKPMVYGNAQTLLMRGVSIQNMRLSICFERMEHLAIPS